MTQQPWCTARAQDNVLILTSVALYRALADSQLHQPGPPQGSGPDWVLSPPPQRQGVSMLLLLFQTRRSTMRLCQRHRSINCASCGKSPGSQTPGDLATPGSPPRRRTLHRRGLEKTGAQLRDNPEERENGAKCAEKTTSSHPTAESNLSLLKTGMSTISGDELILSHFQLQDCVAAYSQDVHTLSMNCNSRDSDHFVRVLQLRDRRSFGALWTNRASVVAHNGRVNDSNCGISTNFSRPANENSWTCATGTSNTTSMDCNWGFSVACCTEPRETASAPWQGGRRPWHAPQRACQ